MIRIVPIIFFLFVIANVFGQSLQLKGKIVADSLDGFAINIVNYTKKIGTTNDEKGYFEIPAAIHDSIIFSSVQYKVTSIIVSKNDLENENLLIKLYPIINRLDQVRVSNISLSGDMSKDTKNIVISPHLDNSILGLPVKNIKQPTLEERRIYTASSKPIDLLLNTLNGKLKKLKKLRELANLDLLIRRGERTFDRTFFIDDLGLPEDLVSDFIYYCAKDEYFKNLLENTKKLSLLEFFQKKAISYKKFKEID